MINQDAIDLFYNIGHNIKYYRNLYSQTNSKMTQERLAEAADVSTALIANIESDKINQGISVFTLWKISKALDIPVQKLLDNPIDSETKV